MNEFVTGLHSGFINFGSHTIANIKLVEKALLGLEGSYIELLTILCLGLLAILPILVPSGKHRQWWRHLVQILGIIIFVFVVYTCMGVFGMIANFFRGLNDIGRENILALYFASVAVVILVTSMLFGPFFCSWICPTGSIQEFIGFLTRKWTQKQKQSGYPFSRTMLLGSLTILVIFLVWLYNLSITRIFFIEDATVYWAFILIILLFLLVWRMKAWDTKLRRLKIISFAIIILGAILHIRITSPVHFGFAKVVDPASILATVMVIFAALLVPRIWCRYLCPWRLAISWASKYSIRKIEFNASACTHCKKCNQECDITAIDQGIINMNECNMCLRCVDSCPEKALLLKDKWNEIDKQCKLKED